MFTVGAIGIGRASCAFTARGPDVDVAAPGCDAEHREASGSTSRGVRRRAAPQRRLPPCSRRFVRTARTWPRHRRATTDRHRPARRDGPSLDTAAAFRAAGLDPVVDAGLTRARSRRVPASPGPARGGGVPHCRSRASRGSEYRRGRLRIALANRPRGARSAGRLTYLCEARAHSGVGIVSSRAASRRFAITARSDWRRVELRYAREDLPISATLVVRPDRLPGQPNRSTFEMMRRSLTASGGGRPGCSAAFSAGRAPAGTYDVVSCGAAPGGVNNAWTAHEHAAGDHRKRLHHACAPRWQLFRPVGHDDFDLPGDAPTAPSRSTSSMPRWNGDHELGVQPLARKELTDSWSLYAKHGPPDVVLDTCHVPGDETHAVLACPGVSRRAANSDRPRTSRLRSASCA